MKTPLADKARFEVFHEYWIEAAVVCFKHDSLPIILVVL
jgi:hypothetical protein